MQTLPTDYSHQQLIDALVNEYENICHDSTLEEGEFTPSEYLTYLQSLTHDELVYETGTDDEFTLSEFMDAHS
jgi:hypothetical protein